MLLLKLIMCGGFTCSKNALTALNVLYIIVAFILIGVPVYGRSSALTEDLPIIGGILICGIFLFLISILGLIGAIKHHQVMLFFYMLILFILFLVQFSVACACLAVNKEQQKEIAKEGWDQADDIVRTHIQRRLNCCGFDHSNSTRICSDSSCKCPSCNVKLLNMIDHALKISGGIGMFFSFTEFLGVWLTVRYRNQKDPRGNPSAFL